MTRPYKLKVLGPVDRWRRVRSYASRQARDTAERAARSRGNTTMYWPVA